MIVGASSGYLSAFLTNVLSLVTVPLSLGYFGHDRYGAWVLISALSVYFSLAGLGLPGAALLFASRVANRTEKRRVIMRGALLVTCCSVVVLAGVLLVGNSDRWLTLLGGFPTDVVPEVCSAAFYTFALSLIALPLNVSFSGFIALHKPHLERVYTTLSMNTYFVALVWTVYAKGDLAGLAVARGILCILVGLIGSIHFLACCRRTDSTAGDVVRDAAKMGAEHEHGVRALLTTGRHFLFSGLAVMVIQQTDTLIISHVLGVGSVAPYQVTFRLVTLGFILFTALLPSLLPLYGGAWVRREYGWIERSANTMLRGSAALGGLVWVSNVAFAKPVIDTWADPAAYAGPLAVVALGAYGYTLSLSGQLFLLLTSQNLVSKIPVIRWVEAGFNLLLSILLVYAIGPAGAAVGSALAALLTVLWLLPREVGRYSQEHVAIEYKPIFIHFCRVIVPSLVAVLAVNQFVRSSLPAIALNLGVVLYYSFASLRQLSVTDILFPLFSARGNAASGKAEP